MAQVRSQVTSNRFPKFKSVEEEAEYWDTHSTSDFEDEWEPAKVEFAKPLQHVTGVSLDAATLGRIAAIARERGVKTSHLMQNWIQTELERAEASSRTTDPTASSEG